VLRRLDLKLRFSRLRAEHATQAFVEAAGTLGIDETQALHLLSHKPLQGGAYALGDFAVVLRQLRLRARRPDAALLREALDAERRARDGQRGRAIGFTV
jgi:hypothetical protein